MFPCCNLWYSHSQPSDSYGPDGGGLGQLREEEEVVKESFIVFAAAEAANAQHQKQKERRRSRRRGSPSSVSSPKPNLPRPDEIDKALEAATESQEEVWYAKWWMCGFQDAFRDLVPKR